LRDRPATAAIGGIAPALRGGAMSMAGVRAGSEQFTDPGLGGPDAGLEPLAGRRSGPVPPPPPQAAFGTSRSPTTPPPIPDAARAAAAAAPTDRPTASEDDSDADGDDPPTAERLRRVGSAPPSARVGSVPPRVQDPESGLGPATSPAVLAPSVRLQGALQTLMERLASRMDVTEPVESAFPSLHQPTLEALIDELANEGVIGPDLDRRFLTQAAVSEAVGLGPLDRLLNNRSVREVVVDGPSRILADLGGGLSAVSSFFSSARAVEIALQRLCARGGKELSDAPIQELDLPDGSQVQVLLPPLARGPLISVRCPPRNATSPDGLITEGMLTVDMLGLLRTAVQRRLNLLVVGPTSSGVSTLLSALAALSQDHERIIALQRVPSLAIQHPHVLSLNLPGAGDKTLSQLLRHAARLRGDRLVIDDVVAEDALGVLTGAAATRGVIAAMHAPSPAAAVEQLELFAQLALGGARAALAPLIAQAFQLLVHVCVDPSGVRRVASIAEIRGARDHTLEVTPLYRYDHGFKASDSRASFLVS
jgi:pilus assembly protein CpaF